MMKKSFIFSYIHEIAVEDQGDKKINSLILFFPYKDIDKYREEITLQLREYFYNNLPPDKIIILCPAFNVSEIGNLFDFNSDIYSFFPFDVETMRGSITAISINGNGEFKNFLGNSIQDSEIDELYNRGMTKIFNSNGGLIVSQSAHHFVFPSGKHCDRFLRTGNVLIHGIEILFIVTALLKKLKNKRFKNIYCDTSSINSLAYAYISFLKELDLEFQDSVGVESFGSYKLFEEAKFSVDRGSLFLVSSSTSGSILKRMTEHRKQNIVLENIAILYGLNVENQYKSQIICDLTYNKLYNPEGLSAFNSFNIYKGIICDLCKEGSKSIEIQGDVFLLEKPVVVGQIINKNHAPSFLNKLSAYYEKPKGEKISVFKCFFKDGGDQKKYEIYIDVNQILLEWSNRKETGRYKKIFEKLERHVIQNIPATVKYLIVLSDKASQLLAEIIAEILNAYGSAFIKDNIIRFDELTKISKIDTGALVVVSSSIVSGRNLLFLSRALRLYEGNYERLFFTFINRTSNSKHEEFLDSNLGLGAYGKNTHRIINVESIYCSEQAYSTPWHQEAEYIKQIEEFCDDEELYPSALEYCKKRTIELNESGSQKGLTNNLFFPSSTNNKPLKIQNGFAFAPADKSFISNATQSEIYFIISCVLNELRVKGLLDQSEYVRNIIDPGNYIRFNDGIIQACLLRAATNDELRYDLTDEMCLKMKRVLGDMIIHYDNQHSEALNEFFYAIAIKKLRLKYNTITECIHLLEEQEAYRKKDSILKGLIGYIKEKILPANDIVSDYLAFSEKQVI
ncbi:MAG: hypothetical protein JWN56_567 [Sphingobacteriales bacterium]|nr:hypothetical protein [Sphingobacteriales bacterium]